MTKKCFSRRDILRLGAGSSLYAAMGFGGLGVKLPERLVPFIEPPIQAAPEAVTRFATTCRECPAGCGMLLFSRDGRIIKAEGLPGHPVNDGALCPRGQSAPQGLYDPDRLRQPVARSGPGKESPVSWEHALERIAQRLKTGAGRAFVLSRPETGALAEILTTFAKTFGGRALFLDPFGCDCLTYAHGTVFGQAVIPSYLLDRCDFLLGFGAEFLEAWLSNVEFTRRFVRMPDLPQDSVPAGPALFFPSLRRDGKIAQPTVIRGKFAYDAYCAFCHGPKGDGEGPVGQSFAPSVPALRPSKLQAMNDETLANAIFTGPGHYPVLARVVPPDDRPSLLLYVRGLNVGAAR